MVIGHFFVMMKCCTAFHTIPFMKAVCKKPYHINNEKGYSIPEDFAIVGYDNIEISGYVNPRLTTVEQDQKLFGRTLWSVITEYNKTGKYQSIELPQKIKMRGSC